MCACVCVHECKDLQKTKKEFDLLVWELQMAASCVVGLRSPNSCPLKEQPVLISTEPPGGHHHPSGLKWQYFNSLRRGVRESIWTDSEVESCQACGKNSQWDRSVRETDKRS